MVRDATMVTILMADDDADDRVLTEEALKECGLAVDLRFVADGEELMDYLFRRGRYPHPETAPRPGLILLDLNMPRKDGREALRDIKAEDSLRQIPVVVLTTSKADEDVHQSYDLGANSFISKPATFDELVTTMRAIAEYWFSVSTAPYCDKGL